MTKTTVTVRGLEIGSGRPKIAVPLVARNQEELRTALREAALFPADLIEYRADYDAAVMEGGKKLTETLQLIREQIKDLPLLFTIRTTAEGGEASISFRRYSELNMQAAVSGLVDLIDIELFTAARGAGEGIKVFIQDLQRQGAKVIGSSHDFQKTPSKNELLHRVKAMQDAGMDITKIAVMPRSKSDVLLLMETTLQADCEVTDRPCVTMSMGPMGALSRVCGSLTGSAITFGTAGAASAPGQIPADELLTMLEILHNDNL